METQLLAPDEEGIVAAAAVIRRQGIVAFPTETVYGLGADAMVARAVARVFAAKERPRFDPVIVHVASPKTSGPYGRRSRRSRRGSWRPSGRAP